MSQSQSTTLAGPVTLATRAMQREAPRRTYAGMVARRFLANRMATAGLAVLIVIVLLVLGAGLLSEHVLGHTTYEQYLSDRFAPVGTDGFLLGSDELGRDTATRLLYGGQVSLGVAGLSIVVSVLIGTAVGIAAGYFGGLVDSVLMRVVDVMLAVPTLFLLLLVAAMFTLGPVSLALLIAATAWLGLARLLRGEVLALRENDYVAAARVIGASDWQVMVRHLVPNILPVLIVWASLTIPGLILAEAGLSFLGLGIQPPQPSWGNMLSNAQRVWNTSAAMVIIPGLAIYLTVFTINLVGNGLRDALDPRLGD